MKEPHHKKKVGIGMLQLAIGPDVLFADDIQREQLTLFEDCKVNGFQDPQCAKWLDEMKLQECRETKNIEGECWKLSLIHI